MKLSDLNLIQEDENADLGDTPAPGDMGDLISTAQAAVILKVSQSRIRQLIADKFLTAQHPVKGRRDSFLKRADVVEFSKKEPENIGRPKGS